LYHSLGLHGYIHRCSEYLNGWVYHHVDLAPDKRTCRNCGARWSELRIEGRFERTFFALPVGRRPQFVVLRGHRQRCVRCGKTLREPITFTEGKQRYLKVFGRYVIELCRITTVQAAADLLGVGWDLVKQIHKEHLRRKLSKVRYLAVDEFAIQKGHRYMTVVMDLETGEILHAHRGRDAASLLPFLWKLKRRGGRPLAVAMDMSEAYANAVREVFGTTVDIVHDPYHVVVLANRAIDETRRAMVRQLHGTERKVIKGTRYLLLRGLEKLGEDALDQLARLMEINEPLYKAYLLKEELRLFWSLPGSRTGDAFLDTWINQARAVGNDQFTRLAQTLDDHRPGLLAYFRHRISTGPLEGLNNKIKVLKRVAYGYRDLEYFKLRLFFLHEKLPTHAFPG
jgi:transposase